MAASSRLMGLEPRRIEGLKFHGTGYAGDGHDRLGVIPFTLTSQPHGLVAAALATEYGIGVRSGCFCAHPYLIRLLGLSPDAVEKVRIDMARGDRRTVPGMVRISFGMYNSTDDIDQLAIALEQIAAGQFNGIYSQERESGDYSALGWKSNTASAFSLGAA